MNRRSFLTTSMIGASAVYLPYIRAAQTNELVLTPATFGAAISGVNPAPLGTTFLLSPGDYDAPAGTAWLCKLVGTAQSPYTFRGGSGVRIGPISIAGKYTTWEDIEFAYTGWVSRWSSTPGSNPVGTPFYWAQMLIYGKGVNLRRCTIHDLAGVNWGVGASDSVMEDCLTYNIGWESIDRGHGHGWYIQNDNAGPKHMRRCVSLLCYATPLKIYGVNAQLEDIHIEDCVSAYGGEGYTYVRSDNGAAHNITLTNLYTYGLQWQHMNAAAGGGPLTVDGGVIVPPIDWYAYVGAKNWQNGLTVRNLQIVARYLVAYWRETVSPGFLDQTTYHGGGSSAWAIWATNAGVAYSTLPAWQAGTGNDANSTLTGSPTQSRIEVIERAQDSVVVVYNWTGVTSVTAPISGLYRNAMNLGETLQIEAGSLLPMNVWTVAPPIGASAPIAAYDQRFGVFLV